MHVHAFNPTYSRPQKICTYINIHIIVGGALGPLQPLDMLATVEESPTPSPRPERSVRGGRCWSDVNVDESLLFL